ncbi:MAG: methionyl-tRNA formyltransferase-like protein [Pseudomonadota bacterium]
MERLDEILRRATAGISEEYFLLPIHGAAAQRRERVYCYELYHQMRSLWPGGVPWFLNGEVDKGGHPLFAGAGAPKPDFLDFLVHVPGQNRNYAALEVKPASFVNRGIRKDLETLQMFRDRGYERAILLVYGAEPDEAAQRLQNCGATPERHAGIELWVHP